MSLGMYAASVPVYQRQLGAVSKLLEKGAAWAATKKVDEAVANAGPPRMATPIAIPPSNIARRVGMESSLPRSRRPRLLIHAPRSASEP